MNPKRLFSSLFVNRDLGCLFLGQVVSQMGDSMYQIGLLWLVLELTGSKSAMGTVAMVSHLPMLLFGLIGGVLVDTFDRRKIMIGADAVRSVLVLAIPVTTWLGLVSLPMLLVLTFVVITFSSLFVPARDALLPALVDRRGLLKANSLIQVSQYTAILIGPAVAAALITMVGVVHLFTVDALTYLVSLGSLLLIRYRPPEKTIHDPGGVRPLIRQLAEIFPYLRHDRRLLFLIVLTAVDNFFIMGPAIVGIPIFVKEILNGGAAGYALVESALGFGMIVGTLLLNYAKKWLGKGRLLLLGLVFDGLTHAVVLWCRSLELLIVLIAFHAIGIPFIVVTRTALIQEWVGAARLGRVFSIINMSVLGVTALTTGFTGWLAEYVSIDVIFGIFGTSAMLCGVVGWLYRPLRES